MDDMQKTKEQLCEELASLRVREQQLRTFYNAAFEGIAIMEEGVLVDVNPRLASMFGYERDEMLGKSAMSFIAPEDREDAERRVVAEYEGLSEMSGVRKDGSNIRFLAIGRAMQYEGRRCRVTSLTDVTELRRAEQNLNELFSAIDDVMFIHDRDTRAILSASPSFERVFGYPVESAPMLTINDLSSGQDSYLEERLAAEFRQVRVEGPQTFEWRSKRMDGELFWSEVLLQEASIDGETRVVATVRNITKRKLAEKELRESEDRYRILLNNQTELIVKVDTDGHLLFVSPSYCEVFGISENELIGSAFTPLVHEDDREHTALEMKELFLPPHHVTIEQRAMTADGWRWFEWVDTGILDSNGDLKHIIGVGRDITERKQMEEREHELQGQLMRAERMQSLGVLAGGVAHDLNNVLGPMVVLPELIQDDIDDFVSEDSPRRDLITESLNIIKTSAERATVVVQGLVAISRRGHYDRIPCDINGLPCLRSDSSCIRILRENYPQITIQHATAQGGLIVLAAADHLNRVVDNLIRNAAEAIEGEGLVHVTTSFSRLDVEHTGYTVVPPGDYAVIDVADNGHGIEPEHLNKIFEPFFSKKRKSDFSGSGLGLSVVHGIVKDHAGFIDVITEVGQGTTFSIYLPAIADATVPDMKRKEEASRGTERVLIVDDEPGQRYLAKKSLRRLGYSVNEAEDGQAALALFKDVRRGISSPFDLVLLDMVMGDELDGLDTLKEILKVCSSQKVIMVSGHAEDDRAKAALALGADWLAKPYSITELAKAVRQKLDSRVSWPGVIRQA